MRKLFSGIQRWWCDQSLHHEEIDSHVVQSPFCQGSICLFIVDKIKVVAASYISFCKVQGLSFGSQMFKAHLINAVLAWHSLVDNVFLESPLPCISRGANPTNRNAHCIFSSNKLQHIPTNPSAPSTSDSLVVLQSACPRYLFLLVRKRLRLATFHLLVLQSANNLFSRSMKSQGSFVWSIMVIRVFEIIYMLGFF